MVRPKIGDIVLYQIGEDARREPVVRPAIVTNVNEDERQTINIALVIDGRHDQRHALAREDHHSNVLEGEGRGQYRLRK